VKLVLFTKMFSRLDVQRLGRMAVDLGFGGLDLAIRPGNPVNPGNVTKALPEAVKIWADMGLAVPMVTTETGFVDPESPVAEKVIAACGQAGVRLLKLGYWFWKSGDNYWEKIAFIRQRLETFARLGAKHGVVPAYHTHSGDFYGVNASALMHLLQGLDPARMGAYLDAGHLKINGEPFGMAVRIVGPHLKMVAVKDVKYVGKERKIVPLGEGLVDWVGVCRDLKAVGFDGPISLHSEYDMSIESLIETVRHDVQRFKGWLAEAGWSSTSTQGTSS